MRRLGDSEVLNKFYQRTIDNLRRVQESRTAGVQDLPSISRQLGCVPLMQHLYSAGAVPALFQYLPPVLPTTVTPGAVRHNYTRQSAEEVVMFCILLRC